jgi:hypothetical protein
MCGKSSGAAEPRLPSSEILRKSPDVLQHLLLPQNCACSVEPSSASVEASPLEITSAT